MPPPLEKLLKQTGVVGESPGIGPSPPPVLPGAGPSQKPDVMGSGIMKSAAFQVPSP